jgi:hypothetical protein
VEHRTVSARQAAGRGTSGDDTARFLRELRQLRDCAGLGQAELAARAHYPHDYIRAVETGPAMPDLPALAAYVRGCGGTVEEWEERWRTLTNTPALPLLSARPGGNSTAATAGARVGSVAQVAELPDPAAIMAALDRVAEKIAASTTPPARPSGATPPPAARSSFAASGFESTAQPFNAFGSTGQTVCLAAAGPPVPSTAVPGTAEADCGLGDSDAKPATSAARAARSSAGPVPYPAGGRRFPLTPQATVVALILLAVCVMGVLAVLI